MATESISGVSFDELKKKIEQKKARVAVIGLGYVGLPLALLYTEQKFPVTGFDIDARKVATLEQGGSYIFGFRPRRYRRRARAASAPPPSIRGL